MAVSRIYLNLPDADKNHALALGVRWEAASHSGWISADTPRAPFLRWLPRMYRPDCAPPHITSEMVPQPMWTVNLRSLLTRSVWDRLRKQTYAAAGYRCQVCGGQGPKWPVECNEQWRYHHDPDNPDHGTQQLLRLAALCPACHTIKHLGKANVDGRLDAALAQLAFVNGWTEAQCQDHARAAFDRWEQRSRMTWQLDLTWLTGHGIDSIEISAAERDTLPAITGLPVWFVSPASARR